jgi:hypothetical protein
MAITVTTAARSTRLTRVENVQSDLGITTDTVLIERLIDEASAAIESYCHRPFAREAYTETLAGYGSNKLMLSRTPIVGTPSALLFDSNVLTDFSVADANAGLLYRRGGFAWTAQTFPGLSAGGGFLDLGSPLPRSEEPLYAVDYIAGYLLPDQNLLAKTTLSAASADNSFNDSAGLLPSLLKAGDIVTTTGFATAANNGRFVATGTPTINKVVVTGGTLVLEAAGAPVTVMVQSLPRDIEKAAIEAVKCWFLTRREDSRIVEKEVGPMRVRYAEPDGRGVTFLPAACVGLLRPWVRVRG